MMRFYWNERTAGDDLRFWSSRYRSGGPWITSRIVHDITARYGVAFSWKGNWRFFGLLVLENKRITRETEAADATCPGFDDPEERCPRDPRDCVCWKIDPSQPTTKSSAPVDTFEFVGYVGKASLEMLIADQNVGCVLHRAPLLHAEGLPLYRSTTNVPKGYAE